MSEPITVTYSLEAVLTRLEAKIDKLETKIERLDEKVDLLTVDMAEVKTKLITIEQQASDNKKAIEKISETVSDLKGFKSFVIPVLIAVITAALTTLGRFVPVP